MANIKGNEGLQMVVATLHDGEVDPTTFNHSGEHLTSREYHNWLWKLEVIGCPH